MKQQELIAHLESLALFYKIKSEHIPTLLNCLGAITKTYRKGEYLLTEGQDMTHLLVLLKGHVNLYKFSGSSCSLMRQVQEGDVIGVASIGRETVPCMMSAVASTSCTVLSIPYRKLMFECTRNCAFHHRLVENLVISISEGQRQLYEKIHVISQKSIRDKLLVLLYHHAVVQKSNTVLLPYSRTELANYLCTDRSALSRELNQMQKEGILSIQENSFTLLQTIL